MSLLSPIFGHTMSANNCLQPGIYSHTFTRAGKHTHTQSWRTMQISDNPLELALPDRSPSSHGPTALSLATRGHRVTSSLLNQRIRSNQEQKMDMNASAYCTCVATHGHT